MDVIRPITILDSMLVSSNVAETDYAEWTSGANFDTGDRCIVTQAEKTATVGSNYLASHIASLAPGNAFFYAVGEDFTGYTGADAGNTPFSIELTDSAGKKATGYVAAGGAGSEKGATNPSLSTEMVPHIQDWVLGTGWSIVDFHAVSANGQTVEPDTFKLDTQALIENAAYYSSMKVTRTGDSIAFYYGATSNPGVSRSSGSGTTYTEYMIADRDTTYANPGFGANGSGSFDGSIWGVSLKQVLDPPIPSSGGLHIVSTPNGNYRAWASIETGFDPKTIATYRIYSDSFPLHRVYESLVDSNTGIFPPNDVISDSPSWLEIGSTNIWRAFDRKCTSQTTNAGTIEYVLTLGEVDGIAFFNVDATTIEVTVTNGVTVVYYGLITLDGATEASLMDLPLGYPAAELSIVITKAGTPACGEIVIGLQYAVGKTLYGPELAITDYSIKEVDTFGNYTLLERPYSARNTFQLHIDNTDIDDVFATLAEYRAQALVWVDEHDDNLLTYGFFKELAFEIASPKTTLCTVEIEGLT